MQTNQKHCRLENSFLFVEEFYLSVKQYKLSNLHISRYHKLTLTTQNLVAIRGWHKTNVGLINWKCTCSRTWVNFFSECIYAWITNMAVVITSFVHCVRPGWMKSIFITQHNGIFLSKRLRGFISRIAGILNQFASENSNKNLTIRIQKHDELVLRKSSFTRQALL